MKKAFSLIELFVVVAVIGIILAIIIPAVSSVRKNATEAPQTQNHTFITLGEPSPIGSFKYAYVIKDTENDQEYIVISETGAAVTITPRLPKKKEE